MKAAFIGGYGHHLLKLLVQDPDSQAAAIAVAGDGVDDAQAWTAGQRFPGAHWYSDAREMLDKFKPDIVNVGAVYAHNGDWICECLQRGIPVLSDKPIASTWEQLEKIKSLVARHNGIVLTEFPFRTKASFRAAKAAIAAGRIGDVVLITGQKSYRFGDKRPSWYGRRSEYGGTVLWVASHAIDAAWYCSGIDFTGIVGTQGNLSRPGYPELEDHTVTVLGLANGGSCVVHADYLRPSTAPTHGDDRLRLAGTKGVIEIRESRTQLISETEGVLDITSEAEDLPFHREVLAAIRREPSVLSTHASLYIAEILLQARTAGDRGLR